MPLIDKTPEYHIVVDSAGLPCGHLHLDHSDALACSHRGIGASILRMQVTRADHPRLEASEKTAPPRASGSVHPTAIVDESAQIGENVTIGPYAIVGPGVIVGPDTELHEHSIVRSGTVIGQGSIIDSFTVVGGNPQDLSFDTSIESGVVVGERVVMREAVTVHRSTRPGGVTEIGDGAMLMANSHVGHDSRVGKNAILANRVILGGHVEVGPHAFLGGGAGVHQFVRIGESAMIGGNASISYDVPPFTMAVERNRIRGLNLVGLRRRQLPESTVIDIKRCYRAVFSRAGDVRLSAAAALEAGECGGTDSGRQLLEFFAAKGRGFARPAERG